MSPDNRSILPSWPTNTKHNYFCLRMSKLKMCSLSDYFHILNFKKIVQEWKETPNFFMQEVTKTVICWKAQPPVSGWALCPIDSRLLGKATMLT